MTLIILCIPEVGRVSPRLLSGCWWGGGGRRSDARCRICSLPVDAIVFLHGDLLHGSRTYTVDCDGVCIWIAPRHIKRLNATHPAISSYASQLECIGNIIVNTQASTCCLALISPVSNTRSLQSILSVLYNCVKAVNQRWCCRL